MTPVTATLKGYQLVCSLTAMFTLLYFCLTGDLHGDSRHAALWCFLHGLPLHNGEQQRQRYCLIHSSSQSLFAHLATSSLFFSISVMFSFSLPCSLFLPIYLLLSLSFHLSLTLFSSCLSSLSNKPPGDLKKELVLFESKPPGPWPFLSSLSPQTYLEGNCQKCLVCADTYLSFFLPAACWNTVSPLSLYL